jgi:hypothetical protein
MRLLRGSGSGGLGWAAEKREEQHISGLGSIDRATAWMHKPTNTPTPCALASKRPGMDVMAPATQTGRGQQANREQNRTRKLASYNGLC